MLSPRSSGAAARESDSSPKTRSNSGVVPVADRAADAFVAAGLGDQAALDEARDDRVGGDAADARDLRAADRPEVRDDRQRLERRCREPALDRPLEQAPARLGRLARGAERPAAGDVLEHDPAAALGVALAEQPQRGLDALRVVVGGLGELVDRQRLRGDDEQRLEGARQPVERAAR